MFDSGETKVADFGMTLAVDQDIRGFALVTGQQHAASTVTLAHISMNDGWFTSVKVLEATSKIQHEAKQALQRRTGDVALQNSSAAGSAPLASAHDVVEKVAILAQLADKHTRYL